MDCLSRSGIRQTKAIDRAGSRIQLGNYSTSYFCGKPLIYSPLVENLGDQVETAVYLRLVFVKLQ
jgi:hypothetical protein